MFHLRRTLFCPQKTKLTALEVTKTYTICLILAKYSSVFSGRITYFLQNGLEAIIIPTPRSKDGTSQVTDYRTYFIDFMNGQSI